MGEQMGRVCSSSTCLDVEDISCGAAEKWKRSLAPDCGAGAGGIGQVEVNKWDPEGSVSGFHISISWGDFKPLPALILSSQVPVEPLSQNNWYLTPMACVPKNILHQPKPTAPLLQQGGCTVQL